MSEAKDFVAKYGGVFEHSPWVAEQAIARNPALYQAKHPVDIHADLCACFQKAGKVKRLEVLLAHPDLAGKLALSDGLTQDSKQEQASAGLDQLSADELAVMTDLNDRYRKRFGFPFIIAVKGLNKHQIKSAFVERVDNDKETEFETACRQVEKIALLRLQSMSEG